MVVSNQFKQTLCIVITLFAVSSGFGAVTVFDSNSVIAEGDTYDQVLIKGDGTVVTMTGGTVGSLSTVGGSKFILTGNTNAFLNAYDDSTMEISGGAYNSLVAYGNSKILVTDSAETSDIYMKGNSQVTVSGSSASIDYVVIYSNSFLKLASGSIREIFAIGNCQIDIEGGTITHQIEVTRSCPVVRISNGDIESIVWWDSGGTLSISGGSVARITSYFGDALTLSVPSFDIIGHNLEASPYGGTHNGGQITGFWNDDTGFTIDLQNEAYAWLKFYDGVNPADCAERPDSDLNNDCVVNLDDLNKLASEWLEDGTR